MSSTFSFCLLGDRDKQQDAHAVCKDLREPGDLLVVVCDGHMDGGEMFSQFIIERMPIGFARMTEVSAKSVRRLFARLDGQLKKIIAPKTNFIGGCTCALVYLKRDFTLVANIGDSPIVVLNENRVSVFFENHSSSNSVEIMRMINRGFILRQNYFYRPNTRVGLVISRSFGDFSFKPGILAEPFVREFHGQLPGELLVVCTDGLVAPDDTEYQLEYGWIHQSLFTVDPFVVKMMEYRTTVERSLPQDNVTAVLVDLPGFYSGHG